jgi:NADH-quinone oxidoreductase subunit K
MNFNWLTDIGLTHYLTVSVVIFSLGIAVILAKRNAIAILMGIELLLNAACLNFVAFSHFGNGAQSGQVVAVFIIVIAAAEAAVALAIIVCVYRMFNLIAVDQIAKMKE